MVVCIEERKHTNLSKVGGEMFILNDDKSIYVTRGDIVVMNVAAEFNDKPYTFNPGDLVRIKVCRKKRCTDVVLEKDFPITDYTQEVQIYLSGEDTKFGDVISKPTDYWYEVELNPLSDPQTIIGYDEDGAKVFKLFPEGADKEVEEYEPDEEEIISRFMDDELDLSSKRPVENQVIARAILRIESKVDEANGAVSKLHVTPQMFGAIGDGKADDTKAIKTAIEAIGGGISTLHLPTGTYLVSEDIPLVSNMTLEGEGNNTVIKRIGNGLDKYNVIKCEGIDNVTIKNIHIQGDRNEHTGDTGEWGSCIGLYSTSNVTIKDCKLTDGWGDGVYVGTLEGPCTNTIVEGCTIDNNRRQGISVINSDRFIARNCIITNTNGTAPESGIDFEANYDTDICKNNIIENCIFYGNASSSIVVGNHKIKYEIIVRNCTSNDGTGVSIYGTSVEGVERGYLTVQNCDFRNGKRCFNIEGKSATGLFVKIIDCELYAGSSNGVCIEYNSSNAAILGGLRVLGCRLDNPTSSVDPVRIINNAENGTYNDIIIDSFVESADKFRLYFYSKVTGSARVNIGKKHSSSASQELTQYSVYNAVDINCSSSTRRITCKESFPYGCPVTIRKTSSENQLEIQLENGTFPQVANAQWIYIEKCYDEVTITHEASGVWSVKTALNVATSIG